MATLPTAAPSALLHTLARQAPSSCRSETIDWTQIGLPEYERKFAVLIHNMLSPDECAELLQAAQASQGNKWEGAMVNIGMGQQRMMTDIRLCDRILWDTPEIADLLLQRIKPHLPKKIISLENTPTITGQGPVKRKETWQLTRLNERLRFLKYTSGMYFRGHQDGSYVTPDGSEISFLTVHIYLNGPGTEPEVDGVAEDASKPLKGGATRFFGSGDNFFDVNPATGACLVFQHKFLIHSGEEVEQGTKYTMRTDIMYRKVEAEQDRA